MFIDRCFDNFTVCPICVVLLKLLLSVRIILWAKVHIYNTEVYLELFIINAITESVYSLARQSDRYVLRKLLSYNKKLSLVGNER